MRVITVARKPISESTVAANVLKHDTGALNIGGCRIGTLGGTSPVGEPNCKNKVYGKGMGGQKFEGSDHGRWPPNLILQHHPGCYISGQEVTKGRTLSRWEDGMKPWGNGAGHPMTAEYMGDEIVDVWTCHPECPVVDLGQQSGVSISRHCDVADRAGGSATNLSMSKSGVTHSDKGTAARFFKQVKP